MPFLHTFYRQFILLCCLALLCIPSHAQKNDYIWLMGYNSNSPGDSSLQGGAYFGISKLDFNQSPAQISYDSLGMNFSRTNVSYCDDDGNLLFYSNGIYVANALDEPIQNSIGLNTGYVTTTWDPGIQTGGYRLPQAILALPSLNIPEQYFLIHSFTDSFPNSNGGDLYYPKILSSLLDLRMNAGHGEMLYKKQDLITGSFGFELTATKHANGRDWWIIVQKRNSNCYYRILLDPSGFHVLSDLTCGGDTVLELGPSASEVFSPDGTKFAHYDVLGSINIFDFDRCTGELSNPVSMPLPIWTDSMWFGNGVAFSTNSRFLYVAATKYLLQYDTWATNIPSSVDTIGVYDGFYTANIPVLQTLFNTPQLAPDGKIYISTGNGTNYFHVINNPDEKGALCNFVQHGLKLRSFNNGIPNFPNYRLGALAGSACDTLQTSVNGVIEKEKILKVFPNPATDAVTIDYGYTNWEKGDVDLEITNAAGQLVYTQHLPMYSGFQRLNIMQYANGVYNVEIKRGNTIVATSQFVKQ